MCFPWKTISVKEKNSCKTSERPKNQLNKSKLDIHHIKDCKISLNLGDEYRSYRKNILQKLNQIILPITVKRRGDA